MLIKQEGTEELTKMRSREPLANLFKDDRVLCDAEMNQYSLNPELQRDGQNESPFELCSDRL